MLRILDSLSPSPVLVLDGTGLKDWLHCPLKWSFRHNINGGGMIGPVDPLPLVAGKAVHAALAHRYRVSKHGLVNPQVRSEMSTIQQKAWQESTLPENASTDWRTPKYVDTLLDAYLLSYPTEPFQVREVEAPFARRLGEVMVEEQRYGVLWQGRRDLVVSYMGTEGEEWVMDHKTSQSEDSNSEAEWGQDLSLLGYVWSRWQFVGRCPTGFIMNTLGWRKPTKTESKHPRFFFKRTPIRVMNYQLEEWRTSVLFYATQILTSLRHQSFPKTGKCWDFGSVCAYRDPCMAPPKDRDRWFSNLGRYRRNTWSPLVEKG